MELNHTVAQLNLSASYSPIGLLKWTLQNQMEESWRKQASGGLQKPSDVDEFKRMLMETSPWLLAVTFSVSLLHIVFDTLAFKNDIKFWRQAKSLEGLSVKSIFCNCFIRWLNKHWVIERLILNQTKFFPET